MTKFWIYSLTLCVIGSFMWSGCYPNSINEHTLDESKMVPTKQLDTSATETRPDYYGEDAPTAESQPEQDNMVKRFDEPTAAAPAEKSETKE